MATLITHGWESSNNNDAQKVTKAQIDTEAYLSSFDAAIIKALGPEKAEEVLDRVRHAGDHRISEDSQYIPIESGNAVGTLRPKRRKNPNDGQLNQK